MNTPVRRFAAIAVLAAGLLTSVTPVHTSAQAVTGSAQATRLSHRTTIASVDLKRLALDKDSFPGKMILLFVSVHTASSDIDYDSLILGNPNRSFLLKRLHSYGQLSEEAHLLLPNSQRGWRIVGIIASDFPTRSEANQAYIADRRSLLSSFGCKKPSVHLLHTPTTTCAWTFHVPQATTWSSTMVALTAAGNVEFAVIGDVLLDGPKKRGNLRATYDLAVHDASVVAEREAEHVRHLLALGATGLVSKPVSATGISHVRTLPHRARQTIVNLKRLALDNSSFPAKVTGRYVSVDTTSSDISRDTVWAYGNEGALFQGLHAYGLLHEEVSLPDFQGGGRIVVINAAAFPTRSEAIQAYMNDRGHILFDYNCKSSVVFNPNTFTNCKTPALLIPNALTTTSAWSDNDTQAGIRGSEMIVAVTAGNVEFVVEGSIDAGPMNGGDLKAGYDLAVHDASIAAEHEAGHVRQLLALGVTGMKKP